MCSPSLTILSTGGPYYWRIKMWFLDIQRFTVGKAATFGVQNVVKISSLLFQIVPVHTEWPQMGLRSLSSLAIPSLLLFLMIFSAYPGIPSFSSNFLFVPLSGAGCCWRWWCSMYFRSCRRRESYKENWSQIFWEHNSGMLFCYVSYLFPLHFKDALLSGFVARFLKSYFAPSTRNSVRRESKYPSIPLL